MTIQPGRPAQTAVQGCAEDANTVTSAGSNTCIIGPSSAHDIPDQDTGLESHFSPCGVEVDGFQLRDVDDEIIRADGALDSCIGRKSQAGLILDLAA